jgi:hypothetical protein
MQRFRDVVRDAERSTVIFNLDMGRVPTINTENMSRKATLALTTMAAKVEKRTGTIPTEESIAIIDDVLSASSGIKFFGNTTKTYNNPRDSLSGAFCTVPVKYEFKDKETRSQAEFILRKTCNVNCSTPYPTILRECIWRTVENVKNSYPDCQVKVLVDIAGHCLKVARRESKDRGWIYATQDIPIPSEALDVRSKKIPDSLKLELPVYSPRKTPVEPEVAGMDTETEEI